MFMTGVSGIIPGTNSSAVGSTDIGVSFVDQDSRINSSGIWTASGLSFGAEAPDRRIIAIVPSSDDGAHSCSAVTIGGVAATKHCEVTGGTQISIWSALVPTGPTGDAVITFTGTGGSGEVQAVFLYRLVGANNSAPDFTATATSNVGSVTIDHNANSVTVAGGIDANTDNSPAHTMTGVDHDANDYRGGTTAMAVGHKANASSGSIVVSMTNVEGTLDKFAALSWS